VNNVEASFNPVMGQMTEVFHRQKNSAGQRTHSFEIQCHAYASDWQLIFVVWKRSLHTLFFFCR